ncbi:hypothetical protein IW262DRAFT_1464326 [Armillaria fumosa]|nr:hypothetical protein IW262DRAFT_1464326 [Armillaria fumosa]
MKDEMSGDVDMVPNYGENKASSSAHSSSPESRTYFKGDRIDGSRFWAILIGIDRYPYYPLHGDVLGNGAGKNLDRIYSE